MLDLDYEDYTYLNMVYKHDILTKEFLDKIIIESIIGYYFRYNWLIKHGKQLFKNIVLSKLKYNFTSNKIS